MFCKIALPLLHQPGNFSGNLSPNFVASLWHKLHRSLHALKWPSLATFLLQSLLHKVEPTSTSFFIFISFFICPILYAINRFSTLYIYMVGRRSQQVFTNFSLGDPLFLNIFYCFIIWQLSKIYTSHNDCGNKKIVQLVHFTECCYTRQWFMQLALAENCDTSCKKNCLM